VKESKKIVDIESSANPHFKKFKKLLTGRGLKKEGMAILAGKKQVAEALDTFLDNVIGWITTPGGDPPPVEKDDLVWYRLPPPLFSEVDLHGTKAPLLLMKTFPLTQWDDEEWPTGLTLFIPFQDPANVGAMIRSAAAFGVAQVVLLEEAANHYHHKSVQAAGVNLFRVPLVRGPSIETLTVSSAPFFSLAADGEDIARVILPRTMGLLVGMEGPGLPRRFTEKKVISISMKAGVESLNAATAAAVALFEWRRRHYTQR
jgi:16S rRNA (guanine527-N7)-methyltransferase